MNQLQIMDVSMRKDGELSASQGCLSLLNQKRLPFAGNACQSPKAFLVSKEGKEHPLEDAGKYFDKEFRFA